MNKRHGYVGNVLQVDLSTGSINKIPLTEELITKFLGAAGINARLAYDAIEPGTEPFSPQNVLVYGVGPLVGTLAPGACKSNITSKSPSSRFIGTSGSGHLGALKFAGYDHVVITGKADRPVYLKIGDEVEIREAGHIWGKDTWATTDAIWQENGRQYAVLAIGPAGENLVRDAAVIANKYSSFARTGMGAVMGSKNLKAIAAYGSQGVTVAQPKRFMDLVKKMCQEIVNSTHYQDFRKHGTLSYLLPLLQSGIIMHKNGSQIAGRDFLSIYDVEKFMQGVDRRHVSCLACPVGCKHNLHGKGGEYAGLALLMNCALAPIVSSSNAGVTGWLPMLKYYEMCNRLGMDHLSISALVAMAIELYEKGIINKSDTGGLTLGWDARTLHGLAQDIAYRRGIGNVLANGLIEAPQQIGRGAEYYSVHYKGLLGGDLRVGFSAMCFSGVTNSRGHNSATGAHATMLHQSTKEELREYCRSLRVPEKEIDRVLTGPSGYNVARFTKWVEDCNWILECFGHCTHFIYQEFDLGVWADLYSAATGIDVDVAGLLEAASRGRDMMRAFNMREGATRKDDSVPTRYFTESVQFEGVEYPPLNREYVDGLITDYYEERGWDPQKGTLSLQRMAELTGVG